MEQDDQKFQKKLSDDQQQLEDRLDSLQVSRYTYVHVCTYIYVCVHVHVHVCMCIYMYCMCVCTCIHTRIALSLAFPRWSKQTT